MMIPNIMASFIINKVREKDNSLGAINSFYSALCDYVENEVEVLYTWGAMTPPPASTPDPMVLLNCKVRTSGSLSPSGATTPETALSQFASDLNAQISGWQVIWPTGFVLPPAFIIPGIVFTPSMATTPEAAWAHICQEIIAGITIAATPGPLSGAHGGFTIPSPGAVFSKIL